MIKLFKDSNKDISENEYQKEADRAARAFDKAFKKDLARQKKEGEGGDGSADSSEESP